MPTFINQVNKDWDCTKETMGAYCVEVRKLEKHFQGLEIHHVVRDLNVAVDVLAKLRSDRAQVPASVFVEELSVPSIKRDEASIYRLYPRVEISSQQGRSYSSRS